MSDDEYNELSDFEIEKIKKRLGITDLEKSVKEIQDVLDFLKNLSKFPLPTYPNNPNPFNPAPLPNPWTETAPWQPLYDKPKCIKCGMILENVMMYSCMDSYCPTFPKVTYKT